MTDLQESEAFFSQETQDLYQSVLQICSILIYTSENFFKQSEAENLIRLSKQLGFFSQLGNNYASGITCNNIGNILLKQGQYFQAIEHFQKSIIYAKYSIKNFIEKNPNSVSSKLLEDYSISSQSGEYKKTINSDLKPNIPFITLIQDKSLSTQTFYQNQSEIKNQTKNQRDEFYYQRMELLTTLFYRKRNYTLALQSYQEYCDEANQKQKIDYEKNLNHNFWIEIKLLFKELIQIARQLPYGEYQEIKLLSHLSKCYFKLQKFQKSQKILQISKMLLLKLEQISFQHKRLSNYSYQSNITQIQQQISNNGQNQHKDFQSRQQNEKHKNYLSQEDFTYAFTNNQNINSQSNNLSNLNFQVRQKKYSLYETQSRVSNILPLNEYNNKKQDKFQKKQNDNSLCIIQDQILEVSYYQNRQRINSSQQGIYRMNRSLFVELDQQEEKCLESFFVNKRRIESQIQEEYLFMNYLSSETLDSIIKLTEAEILIMQKNYFESAAILSSLLEQKLKFMSHYPLKIINYIKQIFDKYHLVSTEVDQMYQQFNNNKTYHLGIIFACNEDPLTVLKSIELASNLVSNVLINQHDQIGILYQNLYDNLIDLNFTLTNSSVVKQNMMSIVDNLQQSISNQKQQSFSNFLNFLNFSDHQKELENKIYPTENTIQDIAQTQIFTQQKQINQLQASNIQDSQNNCLTKQQSEDYKSFDFQSECIEWQCQNKYLNLSRYKNCYENYFQENQDEPISIQNSELNDQAQFNTPIKNKKENKKEQNQVNKRNQTFHFSVRKAISQLFSNQIIYKKSINTISSKKCKISSETQNKYILYLTDKIEINKNELFNQLCQLLFNMEIQLIILSNHKSNNFLEQQPEQIYECQQTQIIRIFYEIDQIINYLKNNRNYFPLCQYPTIIQHF